MFKYVGLALLATISFCKPKPPEPPPVDPCEGVTCPANQHCEGGACVCNPCSLTDLPWCNETGATCGECKHNPTGDACHCEKAPACPPVNPCDGIVCNTGFHCEAGTCIKDEVKPPPPGNTYCPKKLAPTAKVTLNNHKYGNGETTTPWVEGDLEFCRLIHGISSGPNCHLEGWPDRARCEMEIMNGCPVWEYSADNGVTSHICSDDHDTAPISCDHYGDPVNRDDPMTPTTGNTLETLRGFEGQPLACGLQRDSFGPIAGFFTIAHGHGLVTACLPDRSYCAEWIAFNF